MWSAIRSRSTAFFRMMVERGDFTPLHEPFSFQARYGYIVVNGARETSEEGLLTRLRALARLGPVFVKDTTDYRYPGLLADRQFLAEDALHTFIIRHPRETIASYQAISPNVEGDKIGFDTLYEIFTAVTQAAGREPLVLDSDDLVTRPAAAVKAYCANVGIEFRPDALTWEPHKLKTWAPSDRWNAAAAVSTEFGDVAREAYPDVTADPRLREHLRFQLPFYNKLYSQRLIL